MNVWENTFIDQVEENIRLGDMLDRSKLVFYLGIKEQV